MPTIKVEYCGFYQYSWPSHFINLNENQSFHHVYHNKRGVYHDVHGMYGLEAAIFVSFLNFWTYFMSEWAYKKRHVFKNIFKLSIPSYTSHSFLKHLNTILTIRAILTMAYLYHQSFIIRTKLQFINFFISFTNICHLYMLAQILPVNKINRVQSN